MHSASSDRPTRLQPLRALRAVRQLIRTPEDTEQVFHIMNALRGHTTERNLARLQREAPELVTRRDEVLPLLADREWLASLPPDSLGRHYLAFCLREGITADGLVAASEAAGSARSESVGNWFERRSRDTHDLWHVITGYGTQPLGEVCVVAFSFAQIGHAGFGVIALAGSLRHAQDIGLKAAFAPTLEALRNGRRAAWFHSQDWAEQLTRPIDQVRAGLGVRAPQVYLDTLDAYATASA